MDSRIRILRLDASANPGESGSSQLADNLLERLQHGAGEFEIRRRDLNQGAEFIDSRWIGANFTAGGERNAEQQSRLAQSDQLIAELEWADHVVLATPMYNFGVPATLKAWIDQVCRAGVTFRYGENGPEGLLAGKSADIVITTGGAALGSPVDFVSGYLRQVFAFIGIDNVEIIGADQMSIDTQASVAGALAKIEQKYPADTAREVA